MTSNDIVPRYVLVVEDDESVRQALMLSLELDDFWVLGAENGREALKVMAERGIPCLMILDLMMPVMNGWELLEALNKSIEFRKVPVVIVSAHAEFPKAPQIVHVIRKPIELDQLFSQVERHCR